MTQNRKAPAFQEYAASTLANRHFRLMELAERGLFYTLRLECWENGQVPSAPAELAKYLGCDINNIKDALTSRVKAHFIEENGLFTCPELDNYRRHLDEIKDKQSKGGKRGAELTNSKVNRPKNAAAVRVAGDSSGNSRVTRRGSVESLVQLSPVQQSQEQSLDNAEYSSWVTDYNDALPVNEYEQIKG